MGVPSSADNVPADSNAALHAVNSEESMPIHPQAPACSDDAWKLCLQMLDWAARHSYVAAGSVQSCIQPGMFMYADTIDRKPAVQPDKNAEKTVAQSD